MLDLEIRKEISERVDAIQPVLIETLKEQIAIPSVVSYEAGEYPFGIKVHEAFIHFLKTAEDMGFAVKNVDEYGVWKRRRDGLHNRTFRCGTCRCRLG